MTKILKAIQDLTEAIRVLCELIAPLVGKKIDWDK